LLFLDQEIIHHHDPGDGAEQTGIAQQPVRIDRFQAHIGNDQPELLQQLVAHQHQPHQAGENHCRSAVDQLGRDVLEVVGGRHDVRRSTDISAA